MTWQEHSPFVVRDTIFAVAQANEPERVVASLSQVLKKEGASWVSAEGRVVCFAGEFRPLPAASVLMLSIDGGEVTVGPHADRGVRVDSNVSVRTAVVLTTLFATVVTLVAPVAWLVKPLVFVAALALPLGGHRLVVRILLRRLLRGAVA